MRGADHRRELAEDQLRHGLQVLLPLHHPRELGEVRLQPVLLRVARRGLAQVADHLVDVVLERGQLALRLHGDVAGEVALGHGRGDVGDGAHLRGEVRGELVDVVRQIAPRSRGARHVGLAAELSFDTDFAGHRGDLVGERRQRVDHVVDRVASSAISPRASTASFCFRSPFATAVTTLAMPRTWLVRFDGHHVDVVGEVLPRAGHAFDLRLAAELPFRADFARHARDFGGERVELIDHRVDGVLQLEDLALDVDGDLLRQVAVRDGRRHLGDVAHLVGEVRGHQLTLSVRSFHVPDTPLTCA